MNYAWYFAGDYEPNLRALRRNNVISVLLDMDSSTIYFTSYSFLTMIETRNVYFGDYLIVCYYVNYVFKNCGIICCINVFFCI